MTYNVFGGTLNLAQSILLTFYVAVFIYQIFFANSRRNLVNDNTIQTESFLYEMLCIRGVFKFCQESAMFSALH